MPRIRTIKPDILDDEKAAALSDRAWRLWVSMWVLADDYGRLHANVRRLHGQIFWSDDEIQKTDDALHELVDEGLVRLYEINGETYAEIPGWVKHQKVDKPGRPAVPEPGDSSSAMRDFVYFIRRDSDGAVKIGRSWNPEKRMRSLSKNQESKLTLLATMEGGFMEREIHALFADLRISGEWFRWDTRISEYVESRCALFELGSRMFSPDLGPRTIGEGSRTIDDDARARAKETPRERFHRDVIDAWRELAEPDLPTFAAQVIDFETENAITGFVLGQKLEPCTPNALDLVRTLFKRAAKSPLIRGETGHKPFAKPMLWVLRNGSSVLSGKFDSTARAPPSGPQPLRDTFSEKNLDASRSAPLNRDSLPDDVKAVVEKLSKRKQMEER